MHRLCRAELQKWILILSLFGTALCPILIGTLHAGESKATLTLSRFTFGNRISNGSWCPMLHRVENNSDTSLAVGIATEIPLGGQGMEKASFIRTVTLPPHSSRSVESFVLMDYPPDALRPRFQEKVETTRFPDGTTLERILYRGSNFFLKTYLIDMKTGESLHHFELPGLPVHPDALLINRVNMEPVHQRTDESYTLHGVNYLLGEHPSDMDYLTGQSPPLSALMTQKVEPTREEIGHPLQSVFTDIRHLPRKWAAYEGISVLALGCLRSDWVLSPQQKHSLLRYVKSGGRLLIMPANDIESYRDPFWQQLLPVKLMGARPLQDELAPLEKAFGKTIPVDKDRPPLFAEALPGQGEVLYKHNELVLVARRRVSSGEVWFMAVNGEALQQWSRGHALFAKALGPALNPLPGLKTSLPGYCNQFLGQTVGLEAPSRLLIVCLLLGYFILSAVVLLSLRMRGRTELAWPVIMAMAVLGFAFTFIIQRMEAAETGFVIGEVGVATLESGESEGSVTSFIGLFPPAEEQRDLTWTSPDTLASLHPSWSEGVAKSRSLRVLQSNRFTFQQTKLPTLELFSARAMTMVRYGKGVTVELDFDESGVHGQVVNETGYDLERCQVKLNRRSVFIQALPDGGRQRFKTEDLSWDLLPSGLTRSDEEKMRDHILAETLRIPNRGLSISARTYAWPLTFYGWCPEPQACLDMGDKRIKYRAHQLLAIPATIKPAKGKIRIPPGVCGLRLLSGGAQGVYGDPKRPRQRYPNIDWPEQTRIAGADNKRRKEKRNGSTAHPKETMAFGEGKPLTQDQLHAPTQWVPNTIRSNPRFTFLLPKGLDALRVTGLKLHTDIELRGLQARVGIRKPGTNHWTYLKEIDLGEAARTPLRKWEPFMGPGQTLPEFSLNIRPLKGASPTAQGYWKIRIFDIEIEGEMDND